MIPLRILRRTAVAVLLPLLAPSLPAQVPFYRDVSGEAGIFHSHRDTADCWAPLVTGSAWADVDNDSDIDLYVTSYGGPNRLYLNDGTGEPHFTESASALGIDLPDLISNGVVFADYDNDGDQDLYVLNVYGNTLFANQLKESGALAFADVTDFAGIRDGGRAITAAWGDFDRDGFLDLYVTKHKKCMFETDNSDRLYRNLGNGRFKDVTSYLCGGSATCTQINLGLGFSAVWLDYDNDGDSDLYVANDSIATFYPNVLWRNDGSDGAGGWRFTDVSESSGAGVAINSMGLGVADYNNDGWFDFALSSIGDKVLLKSQCDGTFVEVGAEAGVQEPRGTTWGTVFFDYNNDGWEDLYFTHGSIWPHIRTSANMMHENNHDGTFSDISRLSGLDDSSHGRNASIVDINSDGFVDILIANLYDVPRLCENQLPLGGNQNHWLTVTTEGTVGNRDGIGTRLTLTTPDSLTMMREITTGPTHGGGDYRAGYFGLGENDRGSLTVRWLSGIIQEVGTVRADRHLHLREPWPVSVNLEIDTDTVPDSGSGFDAHFTIANHSETGWRGEQWMLLKLPDGHIREISNGSRTVSLEGGSSSSKSPRVRIPASALPGEYWLIAYAGASRDSVEAVDSVWFTKAGAGPMNPPAASGLTGSSLRTFLGVNHPNPFNPSTVITYGLAEQSRITLRIYNLLGQEVSTLVEGIQEAGIRTVVWNGMDNHGRRVASGVYLYRLATGDYVETRRLLLMK